MISTDKEEKYTAKPPISLDCTNCGEKIYQSMDRWFYLNSGGRLCINPYVAQDRFPPASSKSYTLDELEQLAEEWIVSLKVGETEDRVLRWRISTLIAWARKREREVGDDV